MYIHKPTLVDVRTAKFRVCIETLRRVCVLAVNVSVFGLCIPELERSSPQQIWPTLKKRRSYGHMKWLSTTRTFSSKQLCRRVSTA